MSSISSYNLRLQEFDSILNADEINIDLLQQICFGGIPDEGGRRALCWKLLLNYLPAHKSKWKEILAQKRAQYLNFVREIVVEGSCLSKNGLSPEVEDHPLNPSPDSQWRSFFDDNTTLAQIDKDVRRLYPDMMYFQRATAFPMHMVVGEASESGCESKGGGHSGVERLHQRVTTETLIGGAVTRKGLGVSKIECSRKGNMAEDYKPLQQGQEAHWEVVERILFIYAKLNPGQSYVQGMNEIIGPLYYTFSTNPVDEWREHAEEDTFFCFISLMGEIRDFFIRTLDKSASGIGAMMDRLMANLKLHDVQLHEHLDKQEIRPQYFSFRWLTLMLSQEFDLPDVIQIWDSLFSDDKRFRFLVQVCTAMIVLQHDKILSNDFASNVKLLQRYPPCDVRIIINKAVTLEENNNKLAQS